MQVWDRKSGNQKQVHTFGPKTQFESGLDTCRTKLHQQLPLSLSLSNPHTSRRMEMTQLANWQRLIVSSSKTNSPSIQLTQNSSFTYSPLCPRVLFSQLSRPGKNVKDLQI